MSDLKETLERAVKEGKIPHAVVFATNTDGSFTFRHAVGHSVLGKDDPITEDAVFLLASQTKLLVSIAALQVVEKGLIGLDDDVATQLPDLCEQPILKGFDDKDEPILEKRKNTITLRRLLTHSAGLAYDTEHPDLTRLQQKRGIIPHNGTTIEERFAYPLVFEPGTSWLYGCGVDWAGKLVERLTGQTLEEYMKKNMWEPLGITGISFFPYENPELKDKIPAMTVRGPNGKLERRKEPFFSIKRKDCFGGNGAYASMGDFLKVQHSILANDGKLLKPETVELMFTPQLSPEAKRGLTKEREEPYAIGENDGNIDADWSLGGILLLEDDLGRRKKGTLNWGGAPNTFWLIDREAGLALTFGTQVMPAGDPPTTEMITAVELGVYKMAGVRF